MKIQIYGTGCAKCQKLAENSKIAAKRLGIEAEIEKISDINAITDAGIMMTPALAIDGKVMGGGKLLSPDEIARLLSNTGTKPEDAQSCC